MSAPYGYCPVCGAEGEARERRMNGDDRCTNGHYYPSAKALATRPAVGEQVKPTEEVKRWYWTGMGMRTEPGQTNPFKPEEVEQVPSYVERKDFARVSAALASARAEVEALTEKCERLRGDVASFRVWAARIAKDATYMASIGLGSREPSQEAAREPGRSGA